VPPCVAARPRRLPLLGCQLVARRCMAPGTSPPQTPRCYHQLTTRLYRPRAPADSIRPCLSARGSPVCQIWRDRRAGLLDPTRMAASLTGRVLAATFWRLNGAQAFCSLLPWLLLPPGFVPARTAAPRWAGASERTVRGAAEESQWRYSGTASLSFRTIASGIIPVVYPSSFSPTQCVPICFVCAGILLGLQFQHSQAHSWVGM
jgi:hypothetical protein